VAFNKSKKLKDFDRLCTALGLPQGELTKIANVIREFWREEVARGVKVYKVRALELERINTELGLSQSEMTKMVNVMLEFCIDQGLRHEDHPHPGALELEYLSTTLGLRQSDLKKMVTIMREVSEVKAVWIHGVILDRLLNVLSSEGET
jgi:hypothetical protein